jgi:hypothetical protein
VTRAKMYIAMTMAKMYSSNYGKPVYLGLGQKCIHVTWAKVLKVNRENVSTSD